MQTSQDIVYLVDGSSYLHRAYHAIRALETSTGFPTNAVFGFTKMLLKLLAEKRPAYLAVVFDTAGPTFRHDLYPAYKANRPPMPEDLAVQIPRIEEILACLRTPTLSLQGYEADDLIGTLARVAEERGLRVVVISGDKDFRQILSPQTSLWDTMKGAVLDCRALTASSGLEPRQFIDVMGLSGDTSDNVPGIPGVGEKTALDLIKAFGTLEAVLERAGEVKRPKLRDALMRFGEAARLSKRLVTIERFVPLNLTMEDLLVGTPDPEGLSRIFRALEFRELYEQFAVSGRARGRHDLCLSLDALREVQDAVRAKGAVALDTRMRAPDQGGAASVEGIAFAWDENRSVVLPLGHEAGRGRGVSLDEALPLLKEILEDGRIQKLGHDLKRQAHALKRAGILIEGLSFDSMIASYVINPALREHTLERLADTYLGRRMAQDSSGGKGVGGVGGPRDGPDEPCALSGEPAAAVWSLAPLLREKLKEDENEALFTGLEMALVPVLLDMELVGIKIDPKVFMEMSGRFQLEMAALEQEIYREAGMPFNLNSPQQLAFVLFEKLQLPGGRKTSKTRQPSTDVKVLKRLAASSPGVPGRILRYRTLNKLKSTYLDTLVKLPDPSTGRIHTTFNQTVTSTGRLSSSNPNLQNIPVRGEEGRELRRGFVAEPGFLLASADYSQVELRIFAHYSEDAGLVSAFLNGEDVHARTASELMGVPLGGVTPAMRRIAKAINFGIIYGMGPQKLAEELGIELKAAKDYIDAYYKRYPGVLRYREGMVERARRLGFVTTLLQRRRYLPDIRNEKAVLRAEAERMAINSPIQGSAADLIKLAMVGISRWIKEQAGDIRMLLQIHDELLFEVPESDVEPALSRVRDIMEGVYALRVPLKVDVGLGRNWEEAH